MTPRRVPISTLFVAVLALSVVAGGFLAGAGVVGANHGAGDADFSVEPVDARSPGATDVRYGQVVVGQAGVDYATLESMKAVYAEGSWAGCGPDDSEVFGIDRGNTHDGYGVDEELQEHTKSFSAGEDVFRVQFYGEEDFGPSTHLADGDAVVSVASCIDNPAEPGWYQISGSTTGVTEDGERVTVSGASHYFWVCDCEDEAAAREELGPPPSEEGDGGTATPSGDGDGSDGDATDDGSGTDGADDGTGADDAGTPTGDDSTGEDAATGGGEDPEGTPEPTESGGSGGADEPGGSTGAGTGGNGGGSWENHRVRTPTPGSGAGFGGTVALVALVGAALLFYRRR